MIVKIILIIFIATLLILPSWQILAKQSSIFTKNHEIEDVEKRSLYSSPCFVGLVKKYLKKSDHLYGAVVVVSIMLRPTYRQQDYMEALNSLYELTYMIKKADVYHHFSSRVIEKAQLYLIFLLDADEIPNHLKLIKLLPTYNTYAKVIACFMVDMTEEQFVVQRKKAVEILHELDFFDIFVFGLRENSSVLQSYTMFPYDNGNCAKHANDLILVDECELLVQSGYEPLTVDEALHWSKNRSSIKYIEYGTFYPKLPERIRGCVISVTGSAFEPYVVLSRRNQMRIRRGLEVELLNATFHEIGASVSFLLQDPLLRYKRRTLSNTTSVYKAILNKESPFLIGGFMRTPVMNKSIQVSSPYAFDDVTWCVHTADLAPTWLNTFKTYSWQLWIAVGVAILISGLFLYFFIRYEQESRHQNLTWSFLNIFGTLIAMFTVNFFPNRLFIRIFLASLLFAGINLWAAYTSSLISFLTKPRFDKQISSVPEAIEAGYIFYGNINYLDFIKENMMNQNGYPEVVNRYELCESLGQCFDKFQKNKKAAIATSRMQALYNSQSLKIPKYCFDENENIYEYSVTTASYPYHHLLPTLNDMIGRVLQSGLIVKWINDVPSEKPKLIVQGEIKLSLRNLEGIFVMLGIGTLLSIIALVVEWIYFIHKNGREIALNKFKMMKSDFLSKLFD